MNENAGKRKHKLLTKELAEALPRLYSGEETPLAEKVVAIKFFSPYSNWTWYVLEGDPVIREEEGPNGEPPGELVDYTFFAWVEGFEAELGYVALSELEEVTVFGDVPAVERDLYFGEGRKLGEVTELPGWAAA